MQRLQDDVNALQLIRLACLCDAKFCCGV
jgi:hypothetical protein